MDEMCGNQNQTRTSERVVQEKWASVVDVVCVVRKYLIHLCRIYHEYLHFALMMTAKLNDICYCWRSHMIEIQNLWLTVIYGFKIIAYFGNNTVQQKRVSHIVLLLQNGSIGAIDMRKTVINYFIIIYVSFWMQL